MPTIYREGKYRFFFNSREESRRHIHINTSDGTGKFWLEPEIEYSVSYGLSDKEIFEIVSIVKEKRMEFIYEWNNYFKV